MIKYKVLIIDDDSTRKSAYIELLKNRGKFDIDFVEKAADLDEKIASSDASGFVVDVVLDNWRVKLSDVLIKLAKAGRKRPIFLVSSHWDEPNNLLSTLRCAKDSTVVDFFTWSEFTEPNGKIKSDVADTTIYKMLHEFNRFYSRSAISIRDDEPINILHISDTQFGDVASEQSATFLLDRAVGDFLRREHKELHLLVITGDITYTGKPNEYDTAYKWIEKLIEQLWPSRKEEVRERIILVPGNHDVNLQLCALDQYEYDVHRKVLQEISKGISVENNYCHYSLLPFRDFAYRVTKDIRWLTNENNLCWLSDCFLNLGLRFYYLNSVSMMTSWDPKKVAISMESMDKLIQESQSYPYHDIPIFKIFISHHGHSEDKIDGLENWEEFTNFLELSKADLFIHGHGHKWQGKTFQEGEYIYHTPIIMAPSTHLNGKRRAKDELRGFNLIRLVRKDGIVTKIQAVPYEFRKIKISPRDVKITEWVAPSLKAKSRGKR